MNKDIKEIIGSVILFSTLLVIVYLYLIALNKIYE